MKKLKLWLVGKLYHYHNYKWAKHSVKEEYHRDMRQVFYMKYRKLARELNK
jgi:hypothetical protein